jgi:hypothetical protein
MGLGGSKSKIDAVWPLSDMEKEGYEQPTLEWWQEMKAKQALVDKQIKLKHGR